MKPQTLRELAGALLLALGMATLGGLALWRTYRHLEQVRAQAVAAYQEHNAVRERYLRASADEPAIRQTIARYGELQQRGLIGPEHRLDWADRMRAIREERRLAVLEFELAPQQKLRTLDASGDYVLSASSMRLRLGLLHEGDLLRVLADLSDGLSALVVARSCRIGRSGEASLRPEANTSISLNAECELDWLTVSPAERIRRSRQP